MKILIHFIILGARPTSTLGPKRDQLVPREPTTLLYKWFVEHLQQWNMFYYFKSNKDVSWECGEWSRVIWNMKNMCTTHWQVGKIDWLHNLNVTNMSTCDITNINTLENKPFHHFFFQLRIWWIFPKFLQSEGSDLCVSRLLSVDSVNNPVIKLVL